MNSSFKPVILGLSGPKVSKKEYFLFKKHLPLGYILFTRNIENFSQLKNLITQLRSINLNKKTFIIGTNITEDRDCTTFVNYLSIIDLPTTPGSLPSGSVWRCTADDTLRIVP